MTIEEVSSNYGVAVSTLKNAFPRAQASILKKYGVKIIKTGRGAAANYIEEWADDQRANTMYEEVKTSFMINSDQLSMMNWDFHVFLGIITTPMFVFRGSYEDFLRYLEVKVNADNIQELKAALEHLVARDFIHYTIDKTNDNYFIAALWYQTTKDMEIGIEMVTACRRLATAYHKKSWVPLLKTWLAVQMMAENQPYKMEDLKELTGLSDYTLRESCKLLKECDIFKTSRAYRGYQHCIGTNVDLNHEAFYSLPN